MRFILTSLIFVSFAASAAPTGCPQLEKKLHADLSKLSQFFDSGLRDKLQTKSSDTEPMIKTFLESEYDADTASEYTFAQDTKYLPTDTMEAGTATSQAAKTAVMETAERWLDGRDGTKPSAELLKKVENAVDRVQRHRPVYGYDAGAQGWGGSPAIFLLVMVPKCKVVYPFFLGITKD